MHIKVAKQQLMVLRKSLLAKQFLVQHVASQWGEGVLVVRPFKGLLLAKEKIWLL